MATTSKLLQLRPKHKPSSTFPVFFSSSTTSNPDPSEQPSEAPTPRRKPFSFSDSYIEDSRKALAEFRRRTPPPPPPPPSSSPPSFREFYNNTPPPSAGKIDFNAIRGSLRNLPLNKINNQSPRKVFDSLSLSGFKDTLKLRPNVDEPMVIGGTEIPASHFGKENKMKEGGDTMDAMMKTEFVKIYSHDELGKKLQLLRKKDKGFSLHELNERLVKLREIEEKESESRIGGSVYKELKDSLVKLRTSDVEKSKKMIIQRLDVLGNLGSTPSFMLHPPKELLVEKYFHPDNMSSEDKMKLELQKVRDEFKMSESDCGSARVQVAQLTTKIKHLSTVLHKKDKHSRKGLQAMVQKRKKLLKYLRRTDWDSYCLVLSKLHLRDNPDYKF